MFLWIHSTSIKWTHQFIFLVCIVLSPAVGECYSSKEGVTFEGLKAQLAHKKVWMASSIHRGEEEGRMFIMLIIPFHIANFSHN